MTQLRLRRVQIGEDPIFERDIPLKTRGLYVTKRQVGPRKYFYLRHEVSGLVLTSWGERSLARGRDTEILGCIETVLGRHPDVDWTADVVELESRETVLGLRGIVREIEHDLNLQQCGMD